MKQIVKEGEVPQSNAKCPICKCEFIYDRIEIIKESATEYYVSCPCCSENLLITGENLKLLKIL